jgi:RNase P/RNase MRP subunit POP5
MQQKMKNLKPSHREDKRYILIKGKDADRKSIEETILEFIGVLGFAESSPQFLKDKSNRIILAVNRNSVDKIRTSFLISKKDLEIIRVSGTLKKLG